MDAIAADVARRRTVARFRDFDAFAAEVNDYQSEWMRAGSGGVDVTVERLVFGSISVLRLRGEMPPFLLRGGVPAGNALVFQEPRSAPCIWKGREVDPSTVLLHQPGADHSGHGRGRIEWVAVHYDAHALQRTARLLHGDAPSHPAAGSSFHRPEGTGLGALRWAAQQVFHTATALPEVVELAEPWQALEQSMLAAGARAVQSDSAREQASLRPPLSHHRIMRRVEEVLEAKLETPIYVADLCAAADVSERTLRNACQALYRVSPIRYLQLRRLHQVHRALREADTARTSVTEVALRYGFVNLGRFAVDYRRLFGESPSHTLRGAR